MQKLANFSNILLQFEMLPRVSPRKDALNHVCSKTDKTSKLEVKYINAVKGRGVFALASFSKGDFVLEYRGDLIDGAETNRRRSIYHPACLAFMFSFKWRRKKWCIDASRDDGSFGRLVNDEHSHPNCRMKKLNFNRKPHLCLFALHDIQQGEEITYDYGGDDCPWRMKNTLHGAGVRPAETCSSTWPLETQFEEAPGPHYPDPQTTLHGAGVRPAEACSSAWPLETQFEEAPGPHYPDPQTTLHGAGVPPAEAYSSAWPLETQFEEAPGPHTPDPQTTLHGAGVRPAEACSSAWPLETQFEEAPGPHYPDPQTTLNGAGVRPAEACSSAWPLETQFEEAPGPHTPDPQNHQQRTLFHALRGMHYHQHLVIQTTLRGRRGIFWCQYSETFF
ncbi:uncharacterized protein LOC117823139 isoform X2 [Notolabrus celidotus]|uniref:uncharacterized protein LOC117823139 isoform X2 n=1 Tax=Notolabrus celidotus TaxID=1203425 RepID=UPI00148FF55B|nr:uncharacterized protein LOC117823139 isoform X2 [Notolabrus celidotus]